MKKVTLIELTTPNTQAIGIRILSSVAIKKGFERVLLFMCGDHARIKQGEIAQYNKKTVDQIIELSTGSELVGISFLTTFYERAVQLTKACKKSLGTPVIWGGVHATARPEEALEHADMVCIGEGENSFGELLEKITKGKDYSDTSGIWFRQNGNIKQNSLRPLEQNPDNFPFQDYELENQFFFNLQKKEVAPLTIESLKAVSFGSWYNLMMTRGCPMSCTYCYNSTWKEMYGGQKYLRSRTVDNVIDELSIIKTKFPFLNSIMFADDNFFAKSQKTIDEFAVKYSSNINLPFWAQITPLSVNEKKIELMAKSGLSIISMGIQTANNKISGIYGRPLNINDKLIEASQFFNRIYRKYKKNGMKPPQYDFIIDSFWGSEEESYENVELLSNFPKPFELHLAALVPYPGTKIYEKAHAENLIKDELTEVYRKQFMELGPNSSPTYSSLKRNLANLLLVYIDFLPSFLVKKILGKRTRKILSAMFPYFILDKLFKYRWIVDKYKNFKRKYFFG